MEALRTNRTDFYNVVPHHPELIHEFDESVWGTVNHPDLGAMCIARRLCLSRSSFIFDMPEWMRELMRSEGCMSGYCPDAPLKKPRY